MPVVVRYIVKGAMVLYVKGRNRGTNEGVYALTAIRERELRLLVCLEKHALARLPWGGTTILDLRLDGGKEKEDTYARACAKKSKVNSAVKMGSGVQMSVAALPFPLNLTLLGTPKRQQVC